MTMRVLAFLVALLPLTGCLVGTAVGVAGAAVGAAGAVTGAVVGAAVKTTGAVIDAATPDNDDEDDDKS